MFSGMTISQLSPAPSFRIKGVGHTATRLSWKKVKGASGYRIYRSSEKKGHYSAVKTISGAGKTSWKDKNLKAGKTYYYKMRAYKKVNGKITLGTVSGVKKKML